MRHYIKTLALMLMASLGFVACNENDDFDNNQVNYPTEVPSGYYTTDYITVGEYNYSVLWTKNSAGNTECQLFREGTEGEEKGQSVTMMTSDSLVIADSIGVFQAISKAEENFLEKEIKVTMAYRKDAKNFTLQVVIGGTPKGAVVLKKSEEDPTIISIWGDMKQPMMMEFFNDTIQGSGMPEFDGKRFAFLALGEQQFECGYTFENGAGELAILAQEGIIPGKLSYNEKYELIVTIEGINTTFTCSRFYSSPMAPPLPEPNPADTPKGFDLLAIGEAQFGLANFTGESTAFFGEDYNHYAFLYQNQSKPELYCIKPWLNNPEGIIINFNQQNGLVTVPMQSSGLSHSKYGDINIQDIFSALGEKDFMGYFDSKESAFVLPMAYIVKAGLFTAQLDIFQLLQMYEQGASTTSVKSISGEKMVMGVNHSSAIKSMSLNNKSFKDFGKIKKINTLK